MPRHIKKKTVKKKPKSVPKGYHRMVDGTLMKNGTHKSKKKY
jgi:hypothetical protein